MDVAYDHIQEEAFPEDEADKRKKQQGSGSGDGAGAGTDGSHPERQEPGINQEFAEAYKAFSASPWGVKLGGFWASAKKQGEQYYATATQEVTTASETASKGLSDLASRARAITITSPPTSPKPDRPSTFPTTRSSSDETKGEGDDEKDVAPEPHPDRPDSLPADIYKEASTSASSLAARFRAEAARRLKEAQRLEDAADEALLQWGTSLGAFLKDAVSIAPPSSEDVQAGRGEVLFASKDAEGRRVVHATRLDAQLHVIHCSLDSFLKDPKSSEWEGWVEGFDVEKKTAEVARDLEKYEQLRVAMEKLVPEQVEYRVFWARYYFLRHVVETEEARRRELLKGAATNTQEEIAWDESDDEDEASATPKNGQASSSTPTPAQATTTTPTPPTSEKPKTATTQPPPAVLAKDDSDNATLKPSEPRKSNEHSSAGSDASYDLVSGATSRAPGSPSGEAPRKGGAVDSDDDDDWE